MAKPKYPATIYVTSENEGDEQYYLVHKTATEALENTEGNTVTEYKLVSVRTGRLIPEFD